MTGIEPWVLFLIGFVNGAMIMMFITVDLMLRRVIPHLCPNCLPTHTTLPAGKAGSVKGEGMK